MFNENNCFIGVDTKARGQFYSHFPVVG